MLDGSGSWTSAVGTMTNATRGPSLALSMSSLSGSSTIISSYLSANSLPHSGTHQLFRRANANTARDPSFAEVSYSTGVMNIIIASCKSRRGPKLHILDHECLCSRVHFLSIAAQIPPVPPKLPNPQDPGEPQMAVKRARHGP
eukprot:1196326-Prorocentrum_minimum.AAC.13